MPKFLSFFTAERRQALQALAASLAPLLILFGFGSEQEWSDWLVLFGLALTFLASLTSLLNLKQGEWSRGWQIIRGAVYSLGAGAVPVLVAAGYISEEHGGIILTGTGLALAVLSNVLAIFTAGKQGEHELLVAMVELKEEDNGFTKSNGEVRPGSASAAERALDELYTPRHAAGE